MPDTALTRNGQRYGERLLTARDVARRLGVESETVRRWARKGAIGHVHVGPCRRLRFREADLQAAILDHLQDERRTNRTNRTFDDK